MKAVTTTVPRSLPLKQLPLIAFGAVLMVLVSRLPEAVFRARFWADDAIFYTDALARGPDTMLEPYVGYLVVGIRAVAFLEVVVPPASAPLIGSLFSLLTIAAAASFAVSARMP